MAFVNIPKDLSKVKTKVALNLTKRQLICFGAAAVVGIPTYILSRGAIGNTGAALMMMGLMLPMFFLAMYEKDGQSAEILLRNYIRARIFWAGIRTYKTENFYEILEREGKSIATESKTTAKTPVGKRPASKKKQGRSKGVRPKQKK
jgi:hypothetical protein